jgi:hyaluronan synthase
VDHALGRLARELALALLDARAVGARPGRLTNLTLKQGYRTVYQHTSLVYTDAPLQVKKLFKQQLRWARGSQYNTLRMLPWMLAHAPVLAVFFLADILLPFLLVGTLLGWLYRSATGTGTNLYQAILDSYGAKTGWLWIFGLMVASSVLSMAIRQIRHLQEVPSDFFRLPSSVRTAPRPCCSRSTRST